MLWGDHYAVGPLFKGIVQRRVAETAVELYGNPALSNIGGFFYRIYWEKERVRTSHATLNPLVRRMNMCEFFEVSLC